MKQHRKWRWVVNIFDIFSHKAVTFGFLIIGILNPYSVHANESCRILLRDMKLTRSTDPKLLFHGKCAGLCAITATMNSTQLALNDLGHPLLEYPISIMNQINKKHPETRGETAALPSLDITIRLVTNAVMENTDLRITYNIYALPFPWSTPSPTITFSSDLFSHALTPHPGERKVLTYMMFRRSDDAWLGTHAVSLLSYSAATGIAKVIDPNIPTAELEFKMQKDLLSDDEGTTYEMIPLSAEFYKMYPESNVRVHSIASIRIVSK